MLVQQHTDIAEFLGNLYLQQRDVLIVLRFGNPHKL